MKVLSSVIHILLIYILGRRLEGTHAFHDLFLWVTLVCSNTDNLHILLSNLEVSVA
jgi:hypothetical protein